MKSVLVFIVFCLCFTVDVFSQGEIDTQPKIFYRDERTWALSINTNGYGGGYRYAKRIDGFRKTTYEIELYHIKHEKELKVPSYVSQQIGSSFVYGKLNSFFALHAGIGYQRELYQKQDRGSISIRYFYNFGPSLGMLKPVYYRVYVTDENNNTVLKTIRFEPHLSAAAIQRAAPFYVGLKELSVVPGGYGKFGFTFEFSKNDAIFNALETGIMLDTYIKKIQIMADNQNHWIFLSFFLTYRFGKIINSEFKSSDNKVQDLLGQ